MTKTEKGISIIVGLLSIIGLIFSSYLYIDERYAHAEDVKKLEKRLDYKILSDQLNTIQERIWKLDDRYEKKKMENSVKEEYRNLKEQSGQIKQKINELEK